MLEDFITRYNEVRTREAGHTYATYMEGLSVGYLNQLYVSLLGNHEARMHYDSKQDVIRAIVPRIEAMYPSKPKEIAVAEKTPIEAP
jgi:hypothetical protein